MELSGRQWSGFRKRKDGPQQGTLFDVREVPSAPVDSPGMHKRERRAEMVAAMPSTKVHTTDPRHAAVKETIKSRGKVAERYAYNGRPEIAEHNIATDHAGKARRAEIGRELADETTIPASDLRGLAEISEGQYGYGETSEGPDLHPKFGGSTHAHYSRIANGPTIEAKQKMTRDTLVHEIGHHVSTTTPGYSWRQHVRADDPRGVTVGPMEEAFADDYAATHADPKYQGYGGSYLRDNPNYVASRKVWDRGETLSPRQFPEQTEMFETEDAIAPDADAEVKAYTRDEGREVLGWSPIRQQFDSEAIYKHKYPTPEERHDEDRPMFYGANYVSLFNDDVVPERRMDDWQEQSFRHTDPVVRQIWKQKR